jgi:hypothetical protein
VILYGRTNYDDPIKYIEFDSLGSCSELSDGQSLQSIYFPYTAVHCDIYTGPRCGTEDFIERISDPDPSVDTAVSRRFGILRMKNGSDHRSMFCVPSKIEFKPITDPPNRFSRTSLYAVE